MGLRVDRMAASFSVHGQRGDGTFDLPLNSYKAQNKKVDLEMPGEGNRPILDLPIMGSLPSHRRLNYRMEIIPIN